MSEAVAITIDLNKELLESIKRYAEEARVPWQTSVASLLESGLILAQKGRALEGYDLSRCLAWLKTARS